MASAAIVAASIRFGRQCGVALVTCAHEFTELKPDAPDSDAMHEDHDDQKHGAYENFQNRIRVG